MNLKQYLFADLCGIKDIVTMVSDVDYKWRLEVLSGSSIGQHVRHIIEFYLTVAVLADDTYVISYDNRKRDTEIETDRCRCVNVIDFILQQLPALNENQTLVVDANYDSERHASIQHLSNVGRELGYVLEHSIHHQAMIKIGLSALGQNLHLRKNMGVAPATLRYQNLQQVAESPLHITSS